MTAVTDFLATCNTRSFLRVTRASDPAVACHYCGTRLYKTGPAGELVIRKRGATVDHVVPRGLGGGSVRGNYVPSCRWCNHVKDSLLVDCGCPTCAAAHLYYERLILLAPVVTVGQLLRLVDLWHQASLSRQQRSQIMATARRFEIIPTGDQL